MVRVSVDAHTHPIAGEGWALKRCASDWEVGGAAPVACPPKASCHFKGWTGRLGHSPAVNGPLRYLGCGQSITTVLTAIAGTMDGLKAEGSGRGLIPAIATPTQAFWRDTRLVSRVQYSGRSMLRVLPRRRSPQSST